MAQFTNCPQALSQSPGNGSDAPQPARLSEENRALLTPAGRIELPPTGEMRPAGHQSPACTPDRNSTNSLLYLT